jgi:NDP-sugar pyrophosphorylase family protein
MDKPNIERHIDLMRNQMRIQKIVIVLGYLGDSIKAYFGEGSAVSARITYVQNQHIAKRWAWSVRLAKPYFAVCKGSIILSNITDGDR